MGRLENFVVKGGIKVPIGFRFCPTDEELLLYYLMKKAFAQQLPASVISEFDVFQTEPWRLPGDLTENRYFFSNVNGVMCGNIKKRPAGSGSWKSVGKEKQILRSESNELIGMKKTLIFCRGSYQTRTRWVMHQLRLVTSTYPCQIPVADFAVYRIFQKKKIETKMSHQKASSSSKLQRPDDVKASIIDFTVEFGHDNIGHPPPSSPCLSEGCGEISSSKLD